MSVEEEGHGASGRGKRALLVAAGVVILAVGFITLRGMGRRPPLLPQDLEHLASAGSPDVAEACLRCHARDGGVMPLPPSHTGRRDCLGCHRSP